MDQEHRDYADAAPSGWMPMYQLVVLALAFAIVYGGYIFAAQR
jgi:hypothetical protein